MNQLPKALIYSRLLIGILIFLMSAIHIPNYRIYAVLLFSTGLLTDIFDGIIARYLNVSTQHLRRLDSTVDMLFFVLVAFATFIASPMFFIGHYMEVIILFSLEGLTYLICFLKFRKEVATHSIASKIWALILFATLIQVMMTENSSVLFQVCFYIGIITRIEIIAIILLLRTWINDVPGIYQAILLRRGKSIKRNKLFNG